MSEVLRLHCTDGKPDLIMLLTDEDAFTVDVQKDEKGEFIILPNGFMPKKKQRKIRLMGKSE
jgi:hypothetical protein